MSNRRALLFKEEGGGFTSLGLILQVKTDNTGTSDDDQFTIPRFGGGFNYAVETSDGQSFSGQTSNLTITFPSAGTYDIAITGDFPRIFFNGVGDRLKLVDIKQWGNIAWGITMQSAFEGCLLTNVTATDAPNFSAVTTMQEMFSGCGLMTFIDVSNWSSTSSVTSFARMFRFCSNLDTSFAGFDLSSSNGGGTDFIQLGGISTANYDATLIAWEAQAPAINQTWGMGNSFYTEGGAAETARTSLIDTYGWTITDGGAIATSLPLVDINS